MERSSSPTVPIVDAIYPKNIIPSSKVLETFPKLTLNEKEFIHKPVPRSNRKRHTRSTRFKTQPITFSEIKEVDEESVITISNQNTKSQIDEIKSTSEIDNSKIFTPVNKPVVVSDERVDQKFCNKRSFLPP